MTVTAPNGKTLEITGDRVPTEAELTEIFSKAGVATASAPTELERSFVGRMKDAAIDMPVGMVKGAARIGQSIPGVTQATDYMFGLPKGASEKSTEPTNLNQKVGTYLTDVAMIPALGAVETGGPILSKTAGYISNPNVVEHAKLLAQATAELSKSALTSTTVRNLATKFGKEVAKSALRGAFGIGAYEAFKHLF